MVCAHPEHRFEHRPENRRQGGGAHLAHLAVVSSHAVCCGAPVAMAVIGAAAGVSGIAGLAVAVHDAIHSHEVWLVGASGVLVALGALLEWRRVRAAQAGGRAVRLSWLFVASCVAFIVNAGIVASHVDQAHSEAAHSEAAPSGAETVQPVAQTAAQAAGHDHHHHDGHAH